jgi:hypothetical protein
MAGCVWKLLRVTSHARVAVRAPSLGKRAAAFVTAAFTPDGGGEFPG